MIRIYIFTIILVMLGACNAEGVRQNEKTDDLNESRKTDSVKTYVIDSAYLVKEDGKFAPIKINYDTAFNFALLPVKEKKQTPTGIIIEVLRVGNGEKIKKGDVVSLIYRGKLANGKIFETTQAFGKPLPYYVGIKMTLDEIDNILLNSAMGDCIRFTIPANKAYGKQGHGKLIPPNSKLVYEMHIAGSTRYTEPEKGIKVYHIIDKPLATPVQPTSSIRISYMGWTEKGKLFDATVFRGKDDELIPGAGNTIKGWKYTLVNMRLGEKVLVFVPSAMGYGSQGVPEMVPPNSNLIYLLEVKEIN